MARLVKKRRGTALKTEWVDVDTLNPYYKNPRMGDVEVVAESLAKNGQYKPIVVNVGTFTGRPNEVLAGNHTRYGVQRLGWEQIYTTWVDVDDEAAARIVLVDNASADAGTYDDELLADLMKDIQRTSGNLVGTGYTDELLDKMLKQQEKDRSKYEVGDEGSAASKEEIHEELREDKSTLDKADEDLGGVEDLRNDVYFPSDLPYGMPALLEDWTFDTLPSPLDTWGGHELDLDRVDETYWLLQWAAGSAGINWNRAIAYCWAPDEHFERMFTDPKTSTKKLLNRGVLGAVQPNFSVTTEHPKATWIWAKYRANFVARYWQEAGLRVIPDIQLGGSDEGLDISMIGIPKGVCVGTQVQTFNGDMKRIRNRARLLKRAEEILEFPEIIIYGHKDADRLLDRADLDAKIIRVQNRTARRREYLESGEATINTVKVNGKTKKVLKRRTS